MCKQVVLRSLARCRLPNQPTIGWLAVRTGFVNGCRRLRAKRATKKSQTMYLLNRNDTNGDHHFIWQMQVLTEN